MEKIAISKFKATCLAVLEQVRKTGQPVLVTRFGQAVAEISAPGTARKAERKFGTLIGSGEILGDIVGPIGDESDWEATQDGSDEAKRFEGLPTGKQSE
jgi:antitoxin (DNA-binding transcriptional repressor) of toxin-antitoxin stability system